MERPRDHLSVREAARALVVSDRRVRALIRAGSLAAQQVGGRWLLSRADIERRGRRRGRPGRPLGERNAWALLARLSGSEWPELSRWDRSRSKQRLAGRSLLSLADELRDRAEPHFFRGDERVVERLRNDPNIVLSGVNAAAHYDVDVRAPGIVEAYVGRDRLGELVYRYALRPADIADANVALRVVDGSVPRAPSGVALAAAVALDLLESPDDRSRRAGRALARRLR
jgi:excisionase family DNA binding protein